MKVRESYYFEKRFLHSYVFFRQVSSLTDNNDDEGSGFYTPKGKKTKETDSIEHLSPFLETATNFLSKMSKEVEPSAEIQDKMLPRVFHNETHDEVMLFVNSIVPDLRKFDDEHFTLAKMYIAKDIYEVYSKQKQAQQQK